MGIDMFSTRVKTNKIEVDLVLWDTAGQERHFSLTKGKASSTGYFRKANIALIVFDISDFKSFERSLFLIVEARDIWIKSVIDNCPQSTIVAILANKSDLPNAVDIKEAKRLAETHHYKFFETSSLTGLNVQEVKGFHHRCSSPYVKTTWLSSSKRKAPISAI